MSSLDAAAVLSAPVIGMIWAQTVDGVIGRDGGMPWHLPEDMAHFKRTTSGHPVIMGRRTWESFPAKYRPLSDRTNILVSRQSLDPSDYPGAVVVGSLEAALEEARKSPGAEEIWVIGGGQIYAEALTHANSALVTLIDSAAEGDTFAPAFGPDWKLHGVDPDDGWLTGSEGTRYRISLWVRGVAP
ncbi:dihydrofolate reductase [Arthrobacter sp. H5]|uniref:dihydrofolate reductase n=1 Tax=Arthrobacter sp. H5 TaxID=1267973 RepID=UPI0004B3F0BD|nr:dihydrofolate reductase [Arthrobacter sp. H5]